MNRKQLAEFIFSVIFLGFSLFSLPDRNCTAQTRSEEELLENQTETSDETDLAELLEALRRQPVNLNSASENELTGIPFILPGFAKSIVEYRQTHGDFSDLTQLREIPELPADFEDTIRPYVTVAAIEAKRAFPLRIYSRTRLKRQLELSDEYTDSTYFNSPIKFYQRFQIQTSENTHWGVLLEKDSGEKSFRDYQSLFLNLKKLPFNSQLILGDYSFASGLGLVFWGAYGTGLSTDPIASSHRQSQLLKPFQSVDENSAFRGIAWQTSQAKMTTQLLFSRRNIDAAVDETGQVISRYTAGLHRNETELKKKDQVVEQVRGAGFLWEPSENLKLSATFADYRYDHPFICADSLRRRFTFVGTENQVGSLSFNYIRRRLSFYGEIAQCRNQARAVITGGSLHFGDLAVTLLYRNYDPAFQSPRGRAFGQFSESPQNETGFFSAVKYHFSRRTILQSYFYFSRQPWRSYLISMPREFKNFYAQLLHRVNPDWTVTTQWRLGRTEERTITTDQYGHVKNYLVPKLSQNLRLQLDIKLSAYFLMRTRIEKKWTKFYQYSLWQNADLPEHAGWLVYQQINFEPWNGLSLYLRLSFFDISDYAARIYVFENDLPGTLTNRMLMERGSRWFGMALYDWSQGIRLALKYSTDYFDKTSATAANSTEIPGTKNNELAFLLDFSF
jgi:hypothetical protein